MKLENIVTLEKHYFLKETNELLAVGDAIGSATIKIKTKIDEDFNKNFCLDNKSFAYAKKLITNRKFTADTDGVVKITSKEGKLVTSTLDAPVVPFELGETLFKHTYNIKDLKLAAKYIDTKWDMSNAILSGVIVDNHGCVIATDRHKFFFVKPDGVTELDNPVSIPTALIDLLDESNETVELEFSSSKVKATSGDMDIICSIYRSEKIPNLLGVVSKARCGYSLIVPVCKNLTIFNEAELLRCKVDDNGITYKLFGNDRWFEINEDMHKDITDPVEFNLAYKDFMQASNNLNTQTITLTIAAATVMLNDNIILMQCRE